MKVANDVRWYACGQWVRPEDMSHPLESAPLPD
jgi:hypothetical protein